MGNQWCQALGCNYKQCVQMRWECDRDKGESKHAEADIQCVAAATQSSMHPGHFVAFLAAIVISMLMCVAGCLCRESNTSTSEVTGVRQIGVVPKPRSQEGFWYTLRQQREFIAVALFFLGPTWGAPVA